MMGLVSQFRFYVTVEVGTGEKKEKEKGKRNARIALRNRA